MVKGVMSVCGILLLVGCAPARQYAGPARSQSEVARLVVLADGADHFGRTGEVRYDGKILSVDGVQARTMTGIVEVLPGRHEVTVTWKRFQVSGFPYGFDSDGNNFMVSESGTTSLPVDVVAGKRYRLRWPSWNEVGPPHGFVVYD